METPTHQPCPSTVRRNPRRTVRSKTDHQQPSESSIRRFPTEDILSIDIHQTTHQELPKSCIDIEPPENLKVFLRVRPAVLPRMSPAVADKTLQNRISRNKNAWPQTRSGKHVGKGTNMQKKYDICVRVNDNQSVILTPPKEMQELKRAKSQLFGGFSYVFPPESSQDDVYERMVSSLVTDFLRGRSGMLAAMGPSGSGKTHTIFGSPRLPGMVPLALRKIFEQNQEESSKSSRLLHISMFEILSEGGKAERLIDLSPDGADVSLQRATIKGLHEVVASEIAQAESVIALGMLKRSTSSTYLNNQSSRSQCIINIRYTNNKFVGKENQQNNAVLTIVDLAGSEKEKRTGHQGSRLIESNSINNTSMVLSLCLRSLFEHQKNPRKPLQKHFQDSLLTRYLRDYLEGKKRMTLVLTIKPGEEDYMDTSFLLRQASPYMKIKFVNADGQPNPVSNKRNVPVFIRSEQAKRIKSCEVDALEDMVNEVTSADHSCEDGIVEPDAVAKPSEALFQALKINDFEIKDSLCKVVCINCKKIERSGQIMHKMSKALWDVLKQCKQNLKVAQNEVDSLREALRIEKQRYSDREIEIESECRLAESQSRLTESAAHREYVSTNVDGQNSKCGDSMSNPSHSAYDSNASLGSSSKSQFFAPTELIKHNSTNVHEINTKVDLSYGHASCDENLSKTLNVDLDSESKSSQPKKHDSLIVHEINAKLENLKFVDSSCEEYSTETSIVKPHTISESKIDSQVFEEEHESASVYEACSQNIEKPSCGVEKHNSDVNVTMAEPLECEDAIGKDIINVGENSKVKSSCPSYEHSNVEKPKRRLLPVSSILVRSIDDFEDENENPKGKKIVEDKLSKGSISLIRLLI